MRTSNLSNQPSRAFTLLELLVVIAVIGILASILLSVVGGAREKAGLVTSLNNIRELHAANALYANEHGGRYVPILSRDEAGKLTRWLEDQVYRSYLGLTEDQDWPTDLISPNAMVLNSKGIPRYDRSYAMNVTGLTGYSNPSNTWQLRAINVEQPAQTIAMTDALDWIVSYYGAKKYQGNEVSSGSAVAYRYKGQAAVIYYDGHSEARTMDDIADTPDAWFVSSN